MAIRDIIHAGDPHLKQRSAEVPLDEIQSQPIQSLIDDMIESMREYQGVGLAAPQIGVNVRIMCYGFDKNPRYPKAPSVPLTIVINPVLLNHSEDIQTDFEGCLSIAPLRGRVPRFQSVLIEGYDRQGKKIVINAQDFEARIIQHELDHLNGFFFIERIQDFKDFGFTEVLKANQIIP